MLVDKHKKKKKERHGIKSSIFIAIWTKPLLQKLWINDWYLLILKKKKLWLLVIISLFRVYMILFIWNEPLHKKKFFLLTTLIDNILDNFYHSFLFLFVFKKEKIVLIIWFLPKDRAVQKTKPNHIEFISKKQNQII